MSTEERDHLRMLLREAIRVPLTVLSGLAVLAIAGWIGIAINDHFALLHIEREVGVMKQRVEMLWHNSPHASK